MTERFRVVREWANTWSLVDTKNGKKLAEKQPKEKKPALEKWAARLNATAKEGDNE